MIKLPSHLMLSVDLLQDGNTLRLVWKQVSSSGHFKILKLHYVVISRLCIYTRCGRDFVSGELKFYLIKISNAKARFFNFFQYSFVSIDGSVMLNNLKPCSMIFLSNAKKKD